MGVELTPAEIDQFLLASPRAILCVSRENLPPLALPMWFGWWEGKILMNTSQASKKVAPIRRNPAVSCLVESGEDYFALKSVLIMGECEVVDDPEQVRLWSDRQWESKPIYKKLMPEKWPPHLEKFYAKPRAVLIVTPTSITSWDFAKIQR